MPVDIMDAKCFQHIAGKRKSLIIRMGEATMICLTLGF